jgi:CheY-like chemotaxis protein
MHNATNIETEKSLSRPHLKRILLVEDDPFWQTLISRSLLSSDTSDNNIEFRFVRSAKQAEAEIFEHDSAFDLIIADQFLYGGSTGLDLWRKCQISQSEIPFVLLSGLSKGEFSKLVKHDSEPPLFLEKSADISKLRRIFNEELAESFLVKMVNFTKMFRFSKRKNI